MNLLNIAVKISVNDQASDKISTLSATGITKMVALGNIISSVFNAAMSVVSSAVDDAISRVDTLNAFPTVMQNLGYSAEDAEAAMNSLVDAIDGLPTTLDSIVSVTQRMATLCDSLDEATDLSIALNDMLLAGGQSTEYVNSALTQFTQMLSTGTFDVTGWNSVINAAAGQMQQLAEYLLGAGATTDELREALNEGEVSVEDFTAAIIELDQNGTDSITSFSQQAQDATGGIATSMTIMQTAVVNAVGQVLDVFADAGVFSDFAATFKEAVLNIGGDAADLAQTLVDNFDDMAYALGAISDAFTETFAVTFNSDGQVTQFIEDVKGALSDLADTILNEVVPAFYSGLLDFIPALVETLYDLTPALTGATAAFVAFKAGAAIENLLGTFTAAGGMVGIFTTAIGNAQVALSNLWVVLSANPIGVVLAVIAGLVTAFVTLYNTNEDFRNAVDEAWSTIKQVVSDVVDALVTFFTDTIPSAIDSAIEWFEGLGESVSSAIDSIVGWFQELPQNISDAIDSVIQSITDWVTDLAEKAQGVWDSFVGPIIDFFSQSPYEIGYALGEAIGEVILFVQDLGAQAIEAGSTFINNIVEWFQTLPERISEWFTNTVTNASEWVTTIGEQATEAGSTFIDNVITFFQELPDKVAEWLDSVITNASNWVQDMAKQAQNAGMEFITNVVSFIQNLPTRVAEWLDSTITKVKNFATDLANKAKEAGQDFFDNIVDTISTIPDKVFSIGEDIVNGVWNGIKSMWSTFTSNVTSFFSGIVDGVKSTLGIASPSKVFAEIGDYMMEGLSVGVDRSGDEAVSSVNDVLGRFSTTAPAAAAAAVGSTTYNSVYLNGELLQSDSRLNEALNSFVTEVLRYART